MDEKSNFIIASGNALDQHPMCPPHITIHVATLSGHSFDMDVSIYGSIDTLKSRIVSRLNLLKNRIGLVFLNKDLGSFSAMSVQEAGIVDGSTVKVVPVMHTGEVTSGNDSYGALKEKLLLLSENQLDDFLQGKFCLFISLINEKELFDVGFYFDQEDSLYVNDSATSPTPTSASTSTYTSSSLLYMDNYTIRQGKSNFFYDTIDNIIERIRGIYMGTDYRPAQMQTFLSLLAEGMDPIIATIVHKVSIMSVSQTPCPSSVVRSTSL